jgi:hypothetical protein
LARRKVGCLTLVLFFKYLNLLFEVKHLDLLLVLRVLLLDRCGLTLVDFAVEGGDFVTKVGDLFFKGLIVGFQCFDFAVGAVELRVFQGHFLVGLIQLSLQLPLGIFQRGYGGPSCLALRVGFKPPFDLGLDLEAFLFEVSELLYQSGVLLSED